MKKKGIFLAVLCCLMFVMMFTGCSLYEEVLEKDTTTDRLAIDEVGKPSLTQELKIRGEDFLLRCEYNIGDYNLDEWRVTDAKNIGMSVRTEGLPDGYTVTIDHVHADILLKSTSPQINGITQDSMDDTYHGFNQDGFYISDTVEYYNTFSIEGYTDGFYTLWGHAFGPYGGMSSDYERLTEKNILKVGTYAEKLIVVYDILIRTPDSDMAYTKSVLSEVLIPIPKSTMIDSDEELGKLKEPE